MWSQTTRSRVCTIRWSCRGPDGSKSAEDFRGSVSENVRSRDVAGLKSPVEKGKLNFDSVGPPRVPPVSI
jgi:hypothetical protein